ncbi:transporter [Marinoscillum sp.]|uniref:transporter n=1 Tax=Marinoscillum sp. TaxID=2024838 RepID=UPI003BAB14F6
MKLFYLKALGAVCTIVLSTTLSTGQGCVAIRSGCGANVNGGGLLQKNQWQAGTNFRYFHSYKHFRGKHEETYRVEEGSEVINDSFFLDFLISYGISDRWSANLTLPFVYHNRSSMYEHGGNPDPDDPNTPENEFWPGDRHTTSSRGLADIRLGVSYWLFETTSSSNLSVGLGVKLPSGDYRAQDNFYNQGDANDQTIHSGVDQSIQPGDGGLGATLELQGFHPITDNILLSGNFYYLVNPREYYTLETRGRTRDFSVPDQYAARLGALAMLPIHGLYFYGGGRLEGIPSSDLIGGDEGFRRPGYAISLEPGLSYNIRNTSFNLTVPVAIERNRVKSYSDKQSGRHGDAAFADYLINFGLIFKFGGQKGGQLENVGDPINLN